MGELLAVELNATWTAVVALVIEEAKGRESS